MSALSHRNTTFDELAVGQTASIERPVTANDLYIFAHASGNTNPVHMPGVDLDHDGTCDTVAPSLWVGSLVSSVLGTILPGAGTLYNGQTFRFHGRALLGDRLKVSVRCLEKRDAPHAVFETRVEKADGTLVLEGIAEVEAPTHTIVLEKQDLPLLLLDQHDHFSALVARCRQLPPMPTAIVVPDDANSLGGALLSMREGLIDPILIGARDAILRAADNLEADIAKLQLVDVADHGEAARKAVAMVNARDARAVMKGNVHSDELLAQVVKKEGGLRGNRRISHVFVMDAPTRPNLLFISDAAINIAPDLTTKVDIVQNAIDLALACGLAKPKVGILAAVETVNVNMPSTLEAAALAKMADRGQIKGALVDGPLAMDNAVDLDAARTKGIVSSVAGQADVLIVPNLEAGNMLAKQLTFVARAEAAGLVVGAKAPIMLTSRADNDKARLASCAVAQLYDHWRQTGEALGDAALPQAAE
ncbi:Phosphate acetyltransferase [Hyphomicrobiales bacterium]|nr:Phosphate acetyltransferase [Hyphomicrobiales bacterium]CAH1673891.1 Phosphate acetyltransferase [Hyphomicrobiales bacterium]